MPTKKKTHLQKIDIAFLLCYSFCVIYLVFYAFACRFLIRGAGYPCRRPGRKGARAPGRQGARQELSSILRFQSAVKFRSVRKASKARCLTAYSLPIPISLYLLFFKLKVCTLTKALFLPYVVSYTFGTHLII